MLWHFLNKQKIQMEESRSKIEREEAKRAKAIAVEKYNAGDLSGAKEFAVKAKNLDHELIGLVRLIAVLDVLIGLAQKINDEVDWYAVLEVDPTSDLSTIQKRHRNLILDILLDDDNSVGSIVEADNILADCWKTFCNETTREIYDKRREAHLRLQSQRIADYEKQQLKSASQVRVEQPLLSVSGDSGGERKRKAEFRSLEIHASAYQQNKNSNDDVPNSRAMSVPDPDIYDFDKDRTKASFGENQVWAAADDYDGMPRFYALVHSVISQEPFKLRISWLYSKSNEELGPMKWIDSGFYKTSGRFSIWRCSDIESLNSFSHRVKWTKGAQGFVHIYPKKGDVWALYTNWSSSWGVSTPAEVVKEYEMVKVLQDFDEARGVTVASLVKVPGYRTVFRRLPKPKTFPKEDLFRFSHQVPSHLLTCKDGMHVPTRCLDLDPAAMSPELLKVCNEEEMNIWRTWSRNHKKRLCKLNMNSVAIHEAELESNKDAHVQVYRIKEEKMDKMVNFLKKPFLIFFSFSFLDLIQRIIVNLS